LGIKQLLVYGDSAVVINQSNTAQLGEGNANIAYELGAFN
jgi:hypothetical protein